MKLTFLGSGSAFTVGTGNYHTNMLLEAPSGDKLLIDCGSDIRFSLNEAGLDHKAINDVYVSHLHADHAGGLEWLGFNTKFDKGCEQKPNLYISVRLVKELWDKTLSGSMRSIQGAIVGLDDFFQIHPINPNESFMWQGCEFHLVQTVHVMNGFALVPSYGLFFETNGLKIFIPTDINFCPQLYGNIYKMADIIFHDCETALTPSGVHSHFNELATLDDETKSKMWLCHYNPGELPDAKKAGFRGFVNKGDVFDFEILSKE